MFRVIFQFDVPVRVRAYIKMYVWSIYSWYPLAAKAGIFKASIPVFRRNGFTSELSDEAWALSHGSDPIQLIIAEMSPLLN